MVVDWLELQHRPGDTVIAIQPGTFYDCVMPENVQRWAGRLVPDLVSYDVNSTTVLCSLWGPVPLTSLPPGVENTCRAVTHRLVAPARSGSPDQLATVYLVHSLPLLLSAVQVFHGSQ